MTTKEKKNHNKIAWREFRCAQFCFCFSFTICELKESVKASDWPIYIIVKHVKSQQCIKTIYFFFFECSKNFSLFISLKWIQVKQLLSAIIKEKINQLLFDCTFLEKKHLLWYEQCLFDDSWTWTKAKSKFLQHRFFSFISVCTLVFIAYT